VEQLTAAASLKVSSEKASGKDADRVQLEKAIAALDTGERATLLVRTAEGRARANQRGKSLGRGPKPNPTQVAEARGMQSNGRGMREIGEVLGTHASTVSRACSADLKVV
jgi:DNA invertase Pin-like site-specific DNA recombinase